MKTDAEIRRDVESELQWDPSIDDKKIGVIVDGGVVTLTGEVDHYAGKWSAEDIAKRVSGVRALANDIRVKIPVSGMRSRGPRALGGAAYSMAAIERLGRGGPLYSAGMRSGRASSVASRISSS